MCSCRLFQNINLGKWMYAMENEGAKQSKEQFRMYALSVVLVLLATILRAVTQVTSNLTSANVSAILSLFLWDECCTVHVVRVISACAAISVDACLNMNRPCTRC
jgi:hypothetical protein